MLSLIMIKFNYVFIQPAPEVQVITPRITQQKFTSKLPFRGILNHYD